MNFFQRFQYFFKLPVVLTYMILGFFIKITWMVQTFVRIQGSFFNRETVWWAWKKWNLTLFLSLCHLFQIPILFLNYFNVGFKTRQLVELNTHLFYLGFLKFFKICLFTKLTQRGDWDWLSGWWEYSQLKLRAETGSFSWSLSFLSLTKIKTMWKSKCET